MRALHPALIALALLASAGCGRDAPVTASASSARNDAEARIGDVVVHAGIVQTSVLDAAIARDYGVERSDRTAMLLVSARTADGRDAPAAVTIRATAAPVDGIPQPIDLREVRAGDATDRVGTVDIAPPETLHFEIDVTYGSATSRLQLTRDFYPR